MSRTYLDLSRLLVSELGVAGGSGPSAVTGQTGELKNIVQWVAEADVYIQNLWDDWRFLWTHVTGQVATQGSDTIAYVTDLAEPVHDGLVLNAGLTTAYKPEWMDWAQFRSRYGTTPKRTASRVVHWSVSPDQVIHLSHLVGADQAWSLDYYRQPVRMAANGDRSPIPEAMDRIIIARAAIIYGTREDAPEIVTGYSGEYADILERLEGKYLEGHKSHVSGSGANSPTPDWSGY